MLYLQYMVVGEQGTIRERTGMAQDVKRRKENPQILKPVPLKEKKSRLVKPSGKGR